MTVEEWCKIDAVGAVVRQIIPRSSPVTTSQYFYKHPWSHRQIAPTVRFGSQITRFHA
ncbi:hypothetical protein JNW90_28475 [Micromonospora sp. STR1s_5]|nr:hypothetical protein [Micromonospora sp. STR1s_5]